MDLVMDYLVDDSRFQALTIVDDTFAMRSRSSSAKGCTQNTLWKPAVD